MKATIKTSKKVLIIAIAAVILLITLAVSAYITAVDTVSLINSEMSGALSTLENKVNRAMSIEALALDMDNDMFNGSNYLGRIAFAGTEDVQKTLDALSHDQFHAYLIEPDGKVRKALRADDFALTDDQLRQLRESSCLTVTGEDGAESYYEYVKVPQGELITHCKLSLAPPWASLFTGLSKRYDYFITDKSGGRITRASRDGLIGTEAPAALQPSALRLDRNNRSKFARYTGGFAEIGGSPAYCVTCGANGCVIGLYCKTGAIVKFILEDMATMTIALTGIFVIILVFFFLMWRDAGARERKWKRLGGTGRYFEAVQARYLSCFVLLITIVTILFNTHYMEFSAYTMQSSSAYQNLDMLTENLKASESDRDFAVNSIRSYLLSVSDRLTSLFKLNADFMKRETLVEIAENCGVNEILIYDKDGELEQSTGEYVGYRLTRNEDDAMYRAWDVLNSDTDVLFLENGENTGSYILARKRKDAPGLLCFRYANPKLTDRLRYYSKDEAIRGTDFGNATTFYIKLDDDERKTYMIEPYSTEVTVLDAPISDCMEWDNYSGIASIRGRKAYVYTRIREGVSIMSSIDRDMMDSTVLVYNLILLAMFAALLLTLLCGCVCARVPAEDEPEAPLAEERADRNGKTMFANTTFRRMVRYFCILLIVCYCSMMLRPIPRGGTLLEFIFGSEWEKAVNIFSINASVIAAVIAAAAVFLLEKLLKFVGECIGPKGITISSITISVLKFFTLIAVILHALYQFGVNTAALIAGAGLAGVVVGIAAKDVFGDLIAGLFLIFEGNIRVGDFVMYKDFKGEVTDIGTRVTVLKRYNRKLIVNNSDLKQYYRLSDENATVLVEIEVGPDEDLTAIEKLINRSGEWYMRRIPELTDRPTFNNIARFDALGTVICLSVTCAEACIEAAQRKVLNSTMVLFREHGIASGGRALKVQLDSAESDRNGDGK